MTDLKIPHAGESITEVLILEWTRAVGDHVALGETVAVIETDKANMDLRAPAAGVLAQILRPAGAAAAPGDVVGRLDEAATGPAVATPAAPVAVEPPQSQAAPASSAIAQAPRVMPAAAREAADRGLDPAAVQGTGPGGRVLKEDVVRQAGPAGPPPQTVPWPPPELRPDRVEPAADRSAPAPVAPAPVAPAPVAPAPVAPAPVAPAPVAPAPVAPPGPGDVVPMTAIRKRIAERLVGAQHEMALLTTFNEVDMHAVMAVREQHRQRFLERHGVKLGLMGFFVKAAVEALRAFPVVNASIRGDEVVYHRSYDIGVAVGGGKGLVVPVLRDAAARSLADIERTIADFGARAKAGALRLDELQGGTFTISNGGVYGSMLSTPIVNPPQSAILGMHNIVDRPVAVAGRVEIRPVMYLALTYDHRLIDGREAVSFLVRIKECVEDPARILLEV